MRLSSEKPGVSPEIQALRALAVALVVVFHFWPHILTGGYLGVDVFFVISGFLITGHLLREVAATTTIRLLSFWARRIRRLFPAALLVLVATLVAAVVFLPVVRWQQVVTQFWSCLGLVQNWTLGFSAVDYFNSDTGASPLQHYWSLSVEEQFYLVWPLLLLLAAVIARRRPRPGAARVFVGIALVLGIASFVFSIVETSAVPAFAYFDTRTHVWEFVAGGLLACAAARIGAAASGHGILRRAVLHWAALAAGVLLIVIPAWLLTGASLFPGWIAVIPALGTVLVLSVSVVSHPHGSIRVATGFAPIGFIGDISYSLYLWHWPIIIFAGVIDPQLGNTLRVLLLALAVLIAWLTKRFIEDPIRRGTLARRPDRATFAIAAGAIVLVVAASTVPYAAFTGQLANAQGLTNRLDAQHALAEDGPNCFGAGAGLRTDPAACPLSHSLNPIEAALQPWAPYTQAAAATRTWDPTWTSCPSHCSFGPQDASFHIEILGDSHAFQYSYSILPVAKANGWRVTIDWRAACGLAAPGYAGDPETSPGCVAWKEKTIPRVLADPSIDVIVASSYSHRFDVPPAEARLSLVRDAYAETFRKMIASGKPVIVVADSPLFGFNSTTCVAAHPRSSDPCTASPAVALKDDPMKDAAETVAGPDLTLLDLSSMYCDVRCHAVIGGIDVFEDPQHLTQQFAASLAPAFEPLLTRIAHRH